MDSKTASILWNPDEKIVSQANMTRFANLVRETYKPDLGDRYEDLHATSVSNPSDFWNLVWHKDNLLQTMETSHPR